ncbi:hypothetical protein GOM46_00840 [Streptococcus infantis]|uniref:hypothetical protein n=1 Tax=Streptococcus infantis TaxID=68892 RepID=UPI001F2726F8|nr:hypothetical protein [Streptococcus infantis]MCP9057382.1 hypothetical protein [Streptococcus infantis]MCP9081785.1 hypothetical protein [Streptococcus infantis]UJD03168.1 hypothetical protein GOM46_00840 [Streptococcus infantis]
MKTKNSIRLLAVAVLASTLLLGACGNKKEEAKNDNANKTTQTTSSSKTSSSNKDSKSQTSTSTTTSEKAKFPSDQSAATANQSQATTAPETKRNQKSSAKQTPSQVPSNQEGTQAKSNQSTYDPTTDRKLQDKQAEHNKRYKGVLTMVDKDFSAAAGNWKGANGETITVSSGGKFTVESADGKKENYSIQSYSYTLDDGKYNAEVGGGKVIQITTGADGTVSSVVLIQP